MYSGRRGDHPLAQSTSFSPRRQVSVRSECSVQSAPILRVPRSLCSCQKHLCGLFCKTSAQCGRARGMWHESAHSCAESKRDRKTLTLTSAGSRVLSMYRGICWVDWCVSVFRVRARVCPAEATNASSLALRTNLTWRVRFARESP